MKLFYKIQCVNRVCKGDTYYLTQVMLPFGLFIPGNPFIEAEQGYEIHSEGGEKEMQQWKWKLVIMTFKEGG